MTIKQHDTWPPLDAVLSDQDGPIDLTTATTVKLLLKTATGGGTGGGTCTITDAAGGGVRYEWQTADTAAIQSFNGEFEITWSNGEISTVPNDSYITVEIKADLG